MLPSNYDSMLADETNRLFSNAHSYGWEDEEVEEEEDE